MEAARKQIGRPFQRGTDPRRNLGGRPPQPIRAALARKADEATLDRIVDVALSQAQAGDAAARQWIADRLEGKAVARNEQGDPGDFDIPLSEIAKRLRIVPKRSRTHAR